MIEIADDLTNAKPSHEDIGAARLQVHARDRLIGAYNARYRQDKHWQRGRGTAENGIE